MSEKESESEGRRRAADLYWKAQGFECDDFAVVIAFEKLMLHCGDLVEAAPNGFVQDKSYRKCSRLGVNPLDIRAQIVKVIDQPYDDSMKIVVIKYILDNPYKPCELEHCPRMAHAANTI